MEVTENLARMGQNYKESDQAVSEKILKNSRDYRGYNGGSTSSISSSDYGEDNDILDESIALKTKTADDCCNEVI